MNKTRNNSLRAWLTALCAAAICLLGTQTAWGQTTGTTQGVKVGSTDVTTVNEEEVTNGEIKEATSGRTVTVTVADRTTEATPKVARVTVSSTTIPVASVSVSAAGEATSVYAGSTLQMSASVLPAYANNKTVTWSVTNSGSSASINASGLLTAGSAVGTATVTATATDGSGKTGTMAITIAPTIPLTADMITVAAATYTGSPLTPAVTVKYGETTLTQDTDYTIDSWNNNNANAGTTASVTVTGMGAYIGSIVKNFTINKGNQNPTITSDDDRHTLTISGSHGYVRWYNGDSEFVDYAGRTFCIISSLSWQDFNNNHSKIRVECAGDVNWNPKTVFYTF